MTDWDTTNVTKVFHDEDIQEGESEKCINEEDDDDDDKVDAQVPIEQEEKNKQVEATPKPAAVLEFMSYPWYM